METKIKYVGSVDTLDFNQPPFYWQEDKTDLFNFEFEPQTLNNQLRWGNYVSDFKLKTKTFNLKVAIHPRNKNEQVKNELINRINYVASADVSKRTPGKLYVNDEYVDCYIIANSFDNFNALNSAEFITLQVTIPTPEWTSEYRYKYGIESPTDGGFKLPTSFPFAFESRRKEFVVKNDQYSAMPVEIIFYGPCINPSIRFGGQSYGASLELLNSERLIINQLTNTVTKITQSGELIDVFNDRQKTPSVFNFLEPGEHTIESVGTFLFEITVFERKVHPTWK